MPAKHEERRDPFSEMESSEPVEEQGQIPRPVSLDRRPGKRETPIRPTEKRRRPRQVTVTFSDVEIPQRLRRLAKRWGMIGPDGQKANTSALVEYLLLARLEAAEQGDLGPPGK